MATPRSIVVDLDPRAEQQPALARVRDLAVAEGARVHLLVCDYVDHAAGDIVTAGAQMEQARNDFISRLESWLERHAERLRGTGIDVRTRVAWHAPRYEAILETAGDVGADLIIRAARHHSKLERLLVSATDWELIRRARQTVWLVKKAQSTEGRGLRVLAAVDPIHGVEEKLGLDQRILAVAHDIAAINDGSLHLFHAWQPGVMVAPAIAAGPHVPTPVVRVDADQIEQMRKKRLELLQGLAATCDLPEDRVHLVEGPVTAALDDVVDEYDIDAVVAGGVSRGLLERLVIGSTAEAILESVDCDVVVVKPETAGGGQ